MRKMPHWDDATEDDMDVASKQNSNGETGNNATWEGLVAIDKEVRRKQFEQQTTGNGACKDISHWQGLSFPMRESTTTSLQQCLQALKVQLAMTFHIGRACLSQCERPPQPHCSDVCRPPKWKEISHWQGLSFPM